MITPWGKADYKKVYAPGITCYHTPGHGGFFVSKAVRAVMPRHLVNEDGWYEEDCEWSKVAIAFPHLFSPTHVEIAKRTYDQWCKPEAEKLAEANAAAIRDGRPEETV